MEILEKQLSDLDDCLENSSTLEPCAVVAHIEGIALSDDSDLKTVANYLFASDTPPSLVKFLIKSNRSKDKEINKARIDGFKFLAGFIKTSKNILDNYHTVLVNSLFDLYKREDSGELKAALLLPIKNLLRHSRIEKHLQKFDVPSAVLDSIGQTMLEELRFAKKATSKTLKSELFKILGNIVAIGECSQFVIDNIDKIFQLCLATLEQNFSPKSKTAPEFSIISGAFSCLDRCAGGFETALLNNADLWQYCLNAVSSATQADVFRFQAARKALRFIKHHAELFDKIIVNNGKVSFTIVQACYATKKTTTSKHAKDALIAVLTQLSSGFAAMHAKDGLPRDSLDLVFGMIREHVECVNSLTAANADVDFSVECLTVLAAVWPQLEKSFNLQNNLKYSSAGIVESLIRVMRSNFGDTRKIPSSSRILLYVGLSRIMSASGAAISDDAIAVVFQTSVEMMMSYPELLPKSKEMITHNFCYLLASFHDLSNAPGNSAHSAGIFNDFVSTLVPSLFMRSISRASIVTFGEQEASTETRRLVFEYVPLWMEIIKPNLAKTKFGVCLLTKCDYDLSISRRLLDDFMNQTLQLLKRLDLKYNVSADDEIIPTSPVDQELFLNASSLFEAVVFSYVTSDLMRVWFPLFVDACAELFASVPLVSSVYRILNCALQACQFPDVAVDGTSNLSITSTLAVRGLVKGLVARISNFRDELLFTSLSLIFQCPITLIEIGDVISSIVVALKSGSQVELAVLSLERLFVTNNSKIVPHLHEIIPLFDSYLALGMSSIVISDEVSRSEASVVNRIRQATIRLEEQRYLSLSLPSPRNEDKDENSVQIAILRLLGRIGQYNKLLLTSPTDAIQQSLAISSNDAIFIKVGFPILSDASSSASGRGRALQETNTRLQLPIDQLLPRVLQLCSQSSVSTDRQLSSLACESFHAMLLYLLGYSADAFHHKNDVNNAAIYKHVFPVLLQLAVGDSISRQLFEKLLFQVIRWFAGFDLVHHSEVQALVQCLEVGLCSELDKALRDISARGFADFLKWSIKQASKNEMSTQSYGVDTLFSKMFELCASPIEAKRIGAAVVFGRMYKDLREETSLVSRYALRISFFLLKSLQYECSPDAVNEIRRSSQKYVEMIQRSVDDKDDKAFLNRYECLVQNMSCMLTIITRASNSREFPESLEIYVDWLLKNCSHSNYNFRRSCMHCFTSLCPSLSNTAGLAAVTGYFQKLMSGTDGMTQLVELIEGNSKTDSFLIAEICNLELLDAARALNASLDCYNWLITMKYIPIGQLLPVDNVNTGTSKKRKTGNNQETHFPKALQAFKQFCEFCYKGSDEPMPVVSTTAACAGVAGKPALALDTQFAQQADDILRRCLLLVVSVLKNCEPSERQPYGKLFCDCGVWSKQTLAMLWSSLLHTTFEQFCQSLASSNMRPCQRVSITEIVDSSVELSGNLLSTTNNLFGCLDVLDSHSQTKFTQLLSGLLRFVSETTKSSECEPETITSLQKLCSLSLECCATDAAVKKDVIAIFSDWISWFSQSAPKLLAVTKPDQIEHSQRALQLICVATSSISASLSYDVRNLQSHVVLMCTTLFCTATADALYERYGSILTAALTKNNGQLFSNNCADIIAKLASRQSQTLFKFLCRCLNVFLNGMKIPSGVLNEIIDTIYRQLDTLVRLGKLSSYLGDVRLLLLELDSLNSKSFRHDEMRSHFLNQCLSTFQDNKSSCEAIVDCLKLLPYLIVGCAKHSPRSVVNGFTEDNDTIVKIQSSLEEMVANKFPLDSQRLEATSPEGQAFKEILHTLLACLSRTGAMTVLLPPLFPTLREHTAHKHFKMIKLALANMVAQLDFSNSNKASQMLILQSVCQFSMSIVLDHYQAIGVKQTVFDEILIGILSVCTPEDLISLLSSNEVGSGGGTFIAQMGRLIAQDMWTSTDLSALYSQSCAFVLVGLAYDRGNIDDVKERLTRAYHGPTATGRELTVFVSKAAHKASRANISYGYGAETTKIYQAVHRLQAAAFCCLLVVVSKTQLDQKFYDTFLFKDNPGECVWQRVVDWQKVYMFSVDSDSFATYLAGENSEFTSRPFSIGSKISHGIGGATTDLLTDSFLLSSTLSQQVFVTEEKLSDFKHVAEKEFEYKDGSIDLFAAAGGDGSAANLPLTGAVKGFDDNVIAIEQNDINTQPCMSYLMRAIQRMSTIFGETWAKSPTMPFWLTTCRDRLTDYTYGENGSERRNTRLFFLRLFLNQPIAAIVSPWMSLLLPAILDCCVRDLCDPAIATGYHYVLRDVVYTLCQCWSHAKPDVLCAPQVSKLFAHLISSSFSAEFDASILKENLLSIKSLLSLWLSGDDQISKSLLSNLTINLDPLMPLLTVKAGATGGSKARVDSTGTESVRQRLAGLQILKTLLESSYPVVHNSSNMLFLEQLLSALVEGVTYPRKEVAHETSAVAGLVLQKISQLRSHGDAAVMCAPFCERLLTKIEGKFGQKDGVESVISCVRAIAAVHPQFITRELAVRLCSHSLSRFKARQRFELLDLLCYCPTFPEFSVIQNIRPFLSEMLTDTTKMGRGKKRLSLIPLTCLKLLTIHVTELQMDTLDIVLATIPQLVSVENSSVEVREECYKLVVSLCLQRDGDISACIGNDSNSAAGTVSEQIRELFFVLLMGLADPDYEDTPARKSIHRMILDYVEQANVFQMDPFQRLRLLSGFVESKANAEQWLQVSSYLIMATSQYSPDFNAKLFEHNLGKKGSNEFAPMVIDSTSHSQSNVARKGALFSFENTQTLSNATQSQVSLTYVAAAGGTFAGTQSTEAVPRGVGMIRATQEFSWTQTQDLGQFTDGNKFNYAPSQMAGSSSATSVVPSFGSSQASQAAVTQSGGGGENMMMMPPSGIPNYLSSSGQKLIGQRVPTRYHRKSMKIASGVPSTQAKYETVSKYADKETMLQRINESMATKKQKRSSKVVLYRQYREGELPDVSIPLSDLIRPLHRLCLRDAAMAGTVFETIYDAMILHARDTTASVDGMRRQPVEQRLLSDSIGKLISSNVNCLASNSQLASALLTCCLSCIRHERPADNQILQTLSNSPSSIADIAISTRNYHSGILLLEECLLLQSPNIWHDGLVLDQNTGVWRQLLKLYDCLGDKDVLIGLVSRLSNKPETMAALDAEMIGDYVEAIVIYDKLNANGKKSSSDEIELWKDRSYKCHEALGQWGELYDALESTVDSKSSGHDNSLFKLMISTKPASELKDKLLPYYMHSVTQDIDKGDELSLFVNTITSWQPEDADAFGCRRTLESQYSIELAAWFAQRREYPRASAFVKASYSKFVGSWLALRPCAVEAREHLLLNLQRLVEIDDVTKVQQSAVSQSSTAPSCSAVKAKSILNLWKHSQPSLFDPIWAWGEVMKGQRDAFELLLGDDDLTTDAALHLASMHVSTATSAVRQNLLSAVKPQLEHSSKLRKIALRATGASFAGLSMPEVLLVYDNNRANIVRKAGNSDEVNSLFIKTQSLLMTKQKSQAALATIGTESHMMSDCQLLLLRGDLFQCWAFNTDCALTIAAKIEKINESMEQCRAATVLSDSLGETAQAIRLQAAAYGKYAILCDEIISDESLASQKLSVANPLEIVMAYLKGIQFGDSDCRDRTLRMLGIVGKYGITNAQCAHIINNIPVWAFLRYAAQLMGLLDRPEGAMAALLLENLAAVYPNALYFPFNITSESFGAQGAKLSQKLRHLLHSEALECFVESLRGLDHPELRLRDGIKAAWQLAQDKTKTQEAVDIIKSMRKYTTESSWSKVGTNIGNYNKQCAKQFGSKLDTFVGANGEKLSSAKTAYQVLDALFKDVRSQPITKFSSGEVPLAEFSQWLSDFDHTRFRIELPGQYLSNLDEAPDPSNHTFIASFDPKLLVMSSIRKPKRLAIYDSSGKKTYFLVKGGEDLRNDERIEQLFMLMNAVVSQTKAIGSSSLLNDPSNKPASHVNESLRARTYNVIPMTSKLGILEWVSNTAPLKSIISDEMAADSGFCSMNAAAVEGKGTSVNFQSLELASSRNRVLFPTSVDYHVMMKKVSRDEILEMYNDAAKTLPTYFLRKRLLRMATSAEGFLTLRKEFAQSLSVSNLFGYILGIGDRHLENLLMDTKTGAIVPIDFGICFGMGASVLPVPELIPFRLTPQLIGLMQPLNAVVLMRQYMVKCMTRLRLAVPVLKNALEVYINDPVVDWLKSPLASKDDMKVVREEVTWEPRRRMQGAVDKLLGVHPLLLLLEDLSINPTVRREKSLESLSTIVGASCTDGLVVVQSRSSTKQKKNQMDALVKSFERISVGEQVNALLELATDSDVAMRQYNGLAMWI